MKKLPKLFLSTLTIGLVAIGANSSSASALYIDSDNATWYTVEELLEYKGELDQEELDLCGDDPNCRQELNFVRMESDNPKYWALEQLTGQQITVTAVNPGEETLRVLFFDEEMMLKHMGISEPLELGEFYMGWFESDIERIYNYGVYTEELFSDTLPGAHYIYAQRDVSENIIPAGQEFEMSVAGSGLNLNTSGEIAYAAFAEPYFNAMGRFTYTSCLLEPDYTEGVECRMMLSAEKGMRYFPPRETVVDDYQAQDEEQNITSHPEASDNSDSQNPPQTANNNENSNQEAPIQICGKGSCYDFYNQNNTDDVTTDNNIEDVQEASLAGNGEEFITTVAIDKAASATIKAPETGLSVETPAGSIEMPWWIIMLDLIGVASIIWLLLPSHNGKEHKILQKNPKNLPKKS